MSKINQLKATLTHLNIEATAAADKIKAKLQKEYELVFDADKELQEAIKDLENYNEKEVDYMLDHDGLYLWTRFDFDDYKDSLEYLETYLDDYCIRIDSQNDCLMLYLGDDFIAIQDDCRDHDRGVWQCHDQIIEESEYLDENGDVDETLRNQLIEQYMEKTGVFPNVGRVTSYGDFFPVNTSENNKQGAQ